MTIERGGGPTRFRHGDKSGRPDAACASVQLPRGADVWTESTGPRNNRVGLSPLRDALTEIEARPRPAAVSSSESRDDTPSLMNSASAHWPLPSPRFYARIRP